MSGMDDLADLAAYLTARYDEAEALARGVEDHSEPWGGQWEADGNRAVRTYNGHVLAYAPRGELKPGFAAYVAANDPAARLADIALKRAILAEYEAAVATMDRQIKERLPEPIAGDVYLVADPAVLAEVGALSLVVRQLGTEFADHPAYKESWKP